MRSISLAALAVLAAALGRAQCNESSIKPPVTKADVQVAKRARQILDSPKKWNRADTRICPASAKTFSLYCALEKATDEVSGNFEHRGAAMQEARFVIDDVVPQAKDYEHRLMGYNNDPTTSFADIQKILSLLEARIQKRLEEPQAPPCGTLGSADLQILKRVREILNSPQKWNRASTQTCPADAQTFGLYCAFEKASKEVNRSFDGSGKAIDAVRALIDHNKYPARLVDYNNDPAITFSDIQKLLQNVEDQLVKQRADAK